MSDPLTDHSHGRRPSKRFLVVVAILSLLAFAVSALPALAGFGTRTTNDVGDEPFFVTTADLNGDTKLDLIVANEGDANVGILLGNGDGTFQTQVTYAVGTSPHSVAVADFNGDTIVDLAVDNALSHTVSVLLGNGDGTF